MQEAGPLPGRGGTVALSEPLTGLHFCSGPKSPEVSTPLAPLQQASRPTSCPTATGTLCPTTSLLTPS